MKEKANWTQNGLLVVIIAMMGWYISGEASWKSFVRDSFDGLKKAQTEHVKEELIKNQKQDIKIIQNNTKILQLEKENDEIKKMIKIGGF